MVNKGRKMGEFNDGTSKTAAICELRNIESEDTRGVLHFGAGVLYMHEAIHKVKVPAKRLPLAMDA